MRVWDTGKALVTTGILAWALVALAAPAAAHTGDPAGPARVGLRVDAAAASGSGINRNLVGVNWSGNLGRAIRPLGVDLVRLDASFERLFPNGPELDRAAMRGLQASLDRAF